MSRLGPRVVFSAVLGFLVLFPASSIAKAAAPHSSAALVAFSQPTLHLQNNFASLLFEPLWNLGNWNNKKPPVRKLPPAHIPEGGSTALYLGVTGLACLAAISMRRRRTSE